MSKGYHFNGPDLTVWNEDRTPFTTAGRMFNMLATDNIYSFDAAFPDVTKGRISFWSWVCTYSAFAPPDESYGWGCTGIAAVGAPPQDWSSDIVLGAVPNSANIFVGRMLLTRTVAPNSPWYDETLVSPIAGVWMPIAGSVILEEARGFGRTLSIKVSGGNLVASLRQSVSGQSGGFRNWGPAAPTAVSNSSGGGNLWQGSGPQAQLLWSPTSGSGHKSSSGATGTLFGPGAPAIARHRWDGTDPPVYSDPTNFASTYAVSLVGRFGRRN